MRSAGIGMLRACVAAPLLVVAGACSPVPPFGAQGLVAPATFPSRADLDPASACVSRPDPANGGDPAPPDGVVAAGDPADPAGVVAIEVVGLGELVLPSGQLVVDDLFFLGGGPNDLEAIDLDGFAGNADVCLHLAHYATADERVAFVHVRLSDKPVATWVEAGGFGVDSGTGGIASTEAVAAVVSGEEGLVEQYLDELDRHDVNTWSWLNVETDAATGANIIGFSTGFGDGGYPVALGRDVDGRPASVVIDHVVVPWAWLSRVGPVT